MRTKELSQDDIEDVTEMTRKIENALSNILADNEMDLAFSALVSGTVNALMAQCRTENEYKHFRDVYIKILEQTPMMMKPSS